MGLFSETKEGIHLNISPGTDVCCCFGLGDVLIRVGDGLIDVVTRISDGKFCLFQLTQLDAHQSLKDLNLFPQETLILEEK